MRNRALRGCVIVTILMAGMGTSASKKMHPKLPDNQAKIQNPDAKEKHSSPPPIIVNVSPPQKTHDEIEQEAKEREQKTELDRKLVELTGDLAKYTLGLFAATVALVLATGCMAYLGWKQANDMRRSLAIAKESADAAKVSADALKATERGVLIEKVAAQFGLVEAFAAAEVFQNSPTMGASEINLKAQISLKNYGKTPVTISIGL
jgi:hypothetical protein